MKITEYDSTRPGIAPSAIAITDYASIVRILADDVYFQSPSVEKAKSVISSKGFFIASDSHKSDKTSIEGAFSLGAVSAAQYFAIATRQAIARKTFVNVAGSTASINIVRDVLKYVPLRWAATEFAGLELKTSPTSRGCYTEEELYDIISDIYSYIFLEVEASKQLRLKAKVKADIAKLLRHIDDSINWASKVSWLEWFLRGGHQKEHNIILSGFMKLGYAHDQLNTAVLAVIVASTVELSATITNALNILLTQKASGNFFFQNPNDLPSLESFSYEALRIDPLFKGVFRVAQSKVPVAGATSIGPGDRVFLDLVSASSDNNIFPDPGLFHVQRVRSNYIVGDGCLRFLGPDFAPKITAQVLSVILGLPNLRLGPGQSGFLNRFPDYADPLIRFGYLRVDGQQTPWPTSLLVQYDATTVNGKA